MSLKEILVLAIEYRPLSLIALIVLLSLFITNIAFYIFSKAYRVFLDNLLFEDEEEYVELILTTKEWEKLKKQIDSL